MRRTVEGVLVVHVSNGSLYIYTSYDLQSLSIDMVFTLSILRTMVTLTS